MTIDDSNQTSEVQANLKSESIVNSTKEKIVAEQSESETIEVNNESIVPAENSAIKLTLTKSTPSKNQRRKKRRQKKVSAVKSHSIHNEVTGLVLVMIVKNESKIMPRCLESVKPVISGVCITDTGSTDNCVRVIENWCRQNKVPCEVPVKKYDKEGPNRFKFGPARTLSYDNACKYFPKAKYYVLLDADMELVVEPNWQLDDLTDDGYTIYQQTWDSRYQNLRLVKPHQKWRSECVTHEYWSSPLPVKQGVLHTLWIRDHDDGGCKADKYQRDKSLMLEALADPTTPKHHIERYRFYLGQTYLCLKEPELGIEQYRERIKIGGWVEECYYSWYQIGNAYMELKEEAKAVDSYLEAYNHHPKRAEPLIKIARHYREKSKNVLALTFAELAINLGYPYEDGLFIDVATYKYLIDLEISINAFYVPDKKALGYQSQKRLMAIYDKLPEYIQSQVKHNNQFYQC